MIIGQADFTELPHGLLGLCFGPAGPAAAFKTHLPICLSDNVAAEHNTDIFYIEVVFPHEFMGNIPPAGCIIITDNQAPQLIIVEGIDEVVLSLHFCGKSCYIGLGLDRILAKYVEDLFGRRESVF